MAGCPHGKDGVMLTWGCGELPEMSTNHPPPRKGKKKVWNYCSVTFHYIRFITLLIGGGQVP